MCLDIPYDAIQRINIHKKLLVKWAAKVNLTTVLQDREMADRLYLDSAILLPGISSDRIVCDVGSGAGFPGLVLKAIRPELDVTLIEARRKRVSFLKTASREMGLENGLTIKWSRLGWDHMSSQDEENESDTGFYWDEVVSRATFPPDIWLETGKSILAKGGRIWVMAGQPHAQGDDALDWEKEAEKNHLFLERKQEYNLPFCGKKRWLVSFIKQT